MMTVLFAFVLAVQTPPPRPEPPSPPPLPSDPMPPEGPSPANSIFYEDADSAGSTEEARAAVNAFGLCVARLSTRMATETLGMDFRTRAYQSRLRTMANNNRESCFRRRGRMRTSNLIFAGGIAEGLLRRDPVPLNVRLARSALRPAIPTFSPSDAIAVCVVRSVPDEVARLFETEVASEAESEAIAEIVPIVEACNQTGRPFSSNHPGLRAILATAAFRSVHGEGAQ